MYRLKSDHSVTAEIIGISTFYVGMANKTPSITYRDNKRRLAHRIKAEFERLFEPYEPKSD